MSKSINFHGYDISKRIDGSYAVWDYCWYPDEYLDADPEANRKWLQQTQGWRAKGWVLVHVADNFRSAHDWVHKVVTARKGSK
jgi:hypothetical protein